MDNRTDNQFRHPKTVGGIQRNLCDEGHRPQDGERVQEVRQGGDGNSKRNDRRRKSGKDKETIIKPVWPDDYLIPDFPPYHVEDAGIIYCGDCRDILPHLPKVDLVLTDPPYGVKRDKGFEGFEGFGGFGKPIKRIRYEEDDWDSLRPSKEIFDAIILISRDIKIFGGNYFADLLPLSTHWIFWDKLNTMPSFGDGELIWTNLKKKSVKKIVCEYNGLIGKEYERYHPTQKPLKLIKYLIDNQQTILDPFLGSGTTAVAAKELGRKFIGIEIEEKYCEIAVKRLRQGVLDFG